jgi:hypothetical protein
MRNSIIILLAIFVYVTHNSFACGCIVGTNSIKDEISKNGFVFHGKLIKVISIQVLPDSIGYSSKYFKYTFKVIDDYKSCKRKYRFIEVISGDTTQNSCGSKFLIDKHYIVYANSNYGYNPIKSSSGETISSYIQTNKCKRNSEYNRTTHRSIMKVMCK